MIEFPKTYSGLLIGLPGVGKSEYCMQLARDYLENGEKVVYVTTEKSPSDIRERMREIGMDLGPHESKNFLFIDIFTRESDPKEENVLYVDNPSNLNLVSVRLSEASDALGKPVRIIFDSLSTFFLHAPENEIRNFFESINKKIKMEHGFALFTLHEEMHDEKVVIALKAMVLSVLEMEIGDAPSRKRKFRVVFAKKGVPHSPDWFEFQLKKEGLEFAPMGEPIVPMGEVTKKEASAALEKSYWRAAKIAGALILLIFSLVIIGGFFKEKGAPDSGGAYAPPEIDGQLYFFDDFEDGDLKGWDICFDCGGDGGSVVSEDGSMVLRGIGQNDLHAGPHSVADYTFMGRVKIAQGCAFAWVREERGRYQFSICPKGSQIFLSVDEYEVGSTPLAQESAFIPMDKWQDFKVVVTGNNLKFYLNDRLIIDATDESNTFPSGRVGVGGTEDSKVYFDDILVVESPHCDDDNECTLDSYDYQEQKCVGEPIANCCGNGICDKDTEDYSSCPGDCPNCDDKNECTVDEYDYHKQECISTPILDVICCGNGACEIGEDYESCTRDCPNCDDANECTEDSYDYHGQECVNKPIIPCCGNGICDEGVEDESSCPADCAGCDDGNRLTTDSFNYETQECENVVTHYFIDDFEGDMKNWSFHGDGGWSTVKEGDNTVLKLGWAQASLKTEWDNYALKYRFKWVEGNMHGNVRQSDTKEGSNRYLVGISKGRVDTLGKQVGNDFQTLKKIGVEYDSDSWHTLEIKCYDDIIAIYLDDEFLTKYKDTQDPLLSGRIFIEIHTGGSPITPEFLIDDVEVKIVSEGELVYP